MKKDWIETGKVVTTHGIRGEVRVQPWCDSPLLLTEIGTFSWDSEGRDMAVIEQARTHKNVVVMKLQGCDTIEQAQALRNRVLYLNRKNIPMAPGAYLIQDLMGCKVYDADQTEICYGTIVEITQHGPTDVYHIKDETGSLRMFPGIKEVIKTVDLANGSMFIYPLRGLFDNAD